MTKNTGRKGFVVVVTDVFMKYTPFISEKKHRNMVELITDLFTVLVSLPVFFRPDGEKDT